LRQTQAVVLPHNLKFSLTQTIHFVEILSHKKPVIVGPIESPYLNPVLIHSSVFKQSATSHVFPIASLPFLVHRHIAPDAYTQYVSLLIGSVINPNKQNIGNVQNTGDASDGDPSSTYRN
jgi:virulence-associated protein VagC